MTKDMLLWDETIFRNGEVLELDHLPEYFAHRDNQIQALKFSLKPIVRGMRPVNCLVRGPPGTGKTTAIQKVFTEMSEHIDNLIFAKVNCQIDSTRFAVASRIYEKLVNIKPPTSGIACTKVFDKIFKVLASSGKVLVIALDDINYLFPEGHADDVMYSLLRAHESLPGVKIALIAIFSDIGTPLTFDPRVGSVFLPEEINFPRYGPDEVRDILRNRIFHAFFPDVVPDDVCECIVGHVSTTGDLRVGIDLLRRSGLNAERRASRTISIEDVEKAYDASRLVYLCRSISALTEHEQALLGLIAKNHEQQTGDLYKSFHGLTGLGYTRFYEIVEKMNSLQFIDADFSGKGMRGRTRVIRPKYDPQDLLKCLGTKA